MSLKTMESEHQLHRNVVRRRHLRPLQPRTSLSADSPTYRSNIRDPAVQNVPWSTAYTFPHSETTPAILPEPSTFVACSWEPSLLGLPANKQMIVHDNSIYPDSNSYDSTQLLPQENSPLDEMFPAYTGLTSDMTPSSQPFLHCSTYLPAPSKKSSNLDQNTLSFSQFRMPYSLRSFPISHTQSRDSMVGPLPLDYRREDKNSTCLLPTISHINSMYPNEPLKDAYTEKVEKPYAYLLYEALFSAKDHKLSLQEIYRWFEDNTNKANDQNSKGWRSSIRHNLSMNEAFVLYNESSVRGKSKNNYWTLTEEALQNGVQSTTRYRSSISKRPLRAEVVAPQRSESGRKGGSTPRFSSRARRISHYSDVKVNDQLQLNQRFGTQQSGFDMHGLYSQGSSMCVPMTTQRLTPNIPLSSKSSQVAFVRRSHGPGSNPYSQNSI